MTPVDTFVDMLSTFGVVSPEVLLCERQGSATVYSLGGLLCEAYQVITGEGLWVPYARPFDEPFKFVLNGEDSFTAPPNAIMKSFGLEGRIEMPWTRLGITSATLHMMCGLMRMDKADFVSCLRHHYHCNALARERLSTLLTTHGFGFPTQIVD